MRMIFRFKMSVSDYRHMMFSKTFGNSIIRRIFIFGAWIVFLTMLICDYTDIIELTQVIHVCALLVSVAVPAAFLTMEINIIKYRNAYMDGFSAERQIIVDEEGFTFVNKTTEQSGQNSWNEITKLEELKDCFVIQLNRKDAVILPKKGMGDSKKIERFRALADKKISKRFYPLKKKKEDKN